MTSRVAVVAGVRTPYVKAGTLFGGFTAVDLGRLAVAELIARTGLDPAEVDAVNVARVIALFAGIPRSVPAFTVHRNCASGLQAVISAAQSIRDGEADVVIAAGVESMSNIPFFLSRPMQELAAGLMRSRGWK